MTIRKILSYHHSNANFPIARVYPAHLMNAEQHQAFANLWTKINDISHDHESAYMLLESTATISILLSFWYITMSSASSNEALLAGASSIISSSIVTPRAEPLPQCWAACFISPTLTTDHSLTALPLLHVNSRPRRLISVSTRQYTQSITRTFTDDKNNSSCCY